MAFESYVNVEPWVDIPTARCFLQWLATPNDRLDEKVDHEAAVEALLNGMEKTTVDRLAAWLIQQGLGALAYGQSKTQNWDLRRMLQHDMFSAAAESSLKQSQIDVLLNAYIKEGVPVVLLKGGALSRTVYDEPAWRTMTDIDVWVQDAQITPAAQCMASLGYEANVKAERPFALQQMARGEIEFELPSLPYSLVELHWSPFPGWWLTRTAAVDEAALWQKKEPLAADLKGIYQLSPEDMVIHLAVHMAINHRFSQSAVRGLIDIALTAQKRGVDWPLVAERAHSWRVRTAVYLVLSLFNQFIKIEGVAETLLQLELSPWRLCIISRFISPESVLAGEDMQNAWQRFLFLFLLVDRKRDMVKLMWRTLWPEKEWLDARYGGTVGHWKHLWRMIRYREV